MSAPTRTDVAELVSSRGRDAALARFRRALGDDSCLDDSSMAKALYSSDSSLYRVVPTVVAKPRSTQELIAVVQAALESGLPITGRGAGTSIAGNAVGAGLVLHMGRYLDSIISIDPEARTAVVQPGVIQASLQQAVRPFGLRFGPDPATNNRCTIGGMIGNNSCGARALGYGRTADNVISLEVITGTGDLITLGGPGSQTEAAPLPALRQLVDANLATIRTEFGTFSRQTSGYSLEHLLPEKGFATEKFFVGSEGTLGVVTQATVRLVRDAPIQLTVALGYPTMADAADHTPALLPFRPTAAEGLDKRVIDVVARLKGPRAVPRLPEGEGYIIIELVGDDTEEVRARAEGLVAASGAIEGWVVADPKEAARLWQIRTDGAGLAGVGLDKPAWPGWEDAAVPVDRLGDYLRAFEQLLDRHGLHGLPYGHFGEGCVHCRIDFPLDTPGGTAAYKGFMLEAADLVAGFGGSVSGEHGDGRARSELLPAMYSPAALAVFGAVKELFDPYALLNPGVLVDPRPTEADVRVAQTITSPLRATDPDFVQEVHQCTGVGKCISVNRGTGAVMCPSYQATHEDKDSTRGRARMLQEMVNGQLIKGWRDPDLHESLDLCLACKGCRRDCPTGIDVAAYKSRVLEESYRGRIRPLSHYALGWLPRWGRLVTSVPGLGALANLATRTPGVKHLVRGIAGVDQRRPMPLFRSAGAARKQALEPAAPDAAPVAVWIDSFTDSFAGSGVNALVSVLRNAGFAPKIVEQDACCGLTWITTGQHEGARRQLRHALDILHPIALAGVPIIGMEPSCMAVWRSDAAELLPDDDRVPVVAKAIRTLAEFLDELPDWTPPDLSGHTIVAQPHCHQSSVLGWAADARLLARTGAEVITVGGCCGLAGNFGVERGHYEVSVQVAELELLPAVRAAGPQAILLADGFSCRKQLKDLADRDAMTLAELICTHS